MEVKFELKDGQQVNVNTEYQVSDEISVGVRVVGDKCFTGKFEFNDPSLFCCELNGGIEEGEWQFPYNVGVRPNAHQNYRLVRFVGSVTGYCTADARSG